MNVDMISTVIREVAQNQAAQFKSAIDSVKADFERRLQEVEAAKAELEKRHVEEIEALKKSLDVSAEIKALEDLLVEEREKRVSEVAELRKYFEEKIKSADASHAEIEQKHAAEIQALREVVDDRSEVGALEKQIGELRTELAKSREASEAADAELRVSVESVAALGKALSESAEEHKAELAKVVKSLEDMPEIPELPAELADLAEVVKGMVGELAEKVARIEKMASGFMHFRGTWDEEVSDYTKGASVVCKNSLWVATRDNDLGNPGDRDSGWQLCIKSGKVIAPYEHR